MAMRIDSLFPDPSKNPAKFGKYVKRRQRLQKRTGKLINGEQEKMEQLLHATEGRLLQLSGQLHQRYASQYDERSLKNSKEQHYDAHVGGYVFYSAKGKKIPAIHTAPVVNMHTPNDARLSYDIDRIIDNIVQQLAISFGSDDCIRRSDELWEKNDNFPS